MKLNDLPTECFNEVCAHLSVSTGDISNLSLCSKAFAFLCSNKNNDLWNLLLCHRLWAVDPSTVLKLEHNSKADGDEAYIKAVANWHEQYRKMVTAERQYQMYLDNLKQLDLDGWLERHFIGQLAPHWNGWERRYWTWNSQDNSFSAWDDDTKSNCYATFPVDKESIARRVSEQEQIDLTSMGSAKCHDPRNPVLSPRPYCFTLTNTAFCLLWACSSEEQLQVWLDKITLTLHGLQNEGRTYKAPTKYLLNRRHKANSN